MVFNELRAVLATFFLRLSKSFLRACQRWNGRMPMLINRLRCEGGNAKCKDQENG